jgi:hypothetical protein
MPDFYSSDCPKPAEHDSTGVTGPSRLPGAAQTDPSSAASAMVGFDAYRPEPSVAVPPAKGKS